MELYPQVEGLQNAESIDISCCDTSKTMHKQSFMTTSFECVLFPAKIDVVLPHRSNPRYPANICMLFFQLESIYSHLANNLYNRFSGVHLPFTSQFPIIWYGQMIHPTNVNMIKSQFVSEDPNFGWLSPVKPLLFG
jgi:hypothetical protein